MSQISVPEWKLKKLEDVCQDIQPGFAEGKKDIKDGIIHLRMNNIGTNFQLNFDLIRTIEASTEQLKKYQLKDRDIIFNNTNSSKLVGKSSIFHDSRICLYSNHLTRLRVKKEFVLPEWLLFYLRMRWLNGDFERMCDKWINQAAVNNNKIRNLEIPIPPLETQQKIVQKLDHIFTQLEEKKKSILEQKEKMINRVSSDPKSFKNRINNSNNLQVQIKQSILNEAFTGNFTSKFREKNFDRSTILNFCKKIEESIMSVKNKNKHRREDGIKFEIIFKNDSLPTIPSEWIWTNIASIETFVGSGSTPKGGKSVYVEDGIPFIRSQNVHQEGLKLDDIAFITKEIHEQMSRTYIKPSDVLLNITGASIGRSTIVPLNFKEGNVNQHVCIIRASIWINPEYLSWWLNTSFIQNKIVEKQKGETREGLNYTHIRSLPVPITTLEEQNEIIHIIKEKNKYVDFIQSKLIDISELQKKFLKHTNQLDRTVLDYAFSGKLVN